MDRLKKQLEAAEAAQEAQQQAVTEMRLRNAIEREAAKAHIDPDEAWALVDRAGVEVAEDGTVTGADKAIKTLATTRPHLVKTQQTVSTDSKTTGGTKPKPTEADVKEFAARYGLRPEDVDPNLLQNVLSLQ